MALNGNALGDLLKTNVMAAVAALGQNSDPANAGTYQTAMFRAFGNTIVDYLKANATIEALTVTNTPADGANHTHAPAATVEATGKIK